MQHIKLLPFRFNVEPLYEQLRSHPEAWNTLPHRTEFEGSPHREVDDIWVRYNSVERLGRQLTQDFNDEHESVWYSVADILPAAKILSLELNLLLGAERMGGVLITRVPAGRQVYPHVDKGWHARFYDKYIIQIRSEPGQRFCFESDSLDARTGECYWFDNAYSHWVQNPTLSDRISLIICLRNSLCH